MTANWKYGGLLWKWERCDTQGETTNIENAHDTLLLTATGRKTRPARLPVMKAIKPLGFNEKPFSVTHLEPSSLVTSTSSR